MFPVLPGCGKIDSASGNAWVCQGETGLSSQILQKMEDEKVLSSPSVVDRYLVLCFPTRKD